jgi:hypothetical protein
VLSTFYAPVDEPLSISIESSNRVARTNNLAKSWSSLVYTAVNCTKPDIVEYHIVERNVIPQGMALKSCTDSLIYSMYRI